MPGRNGSQLPFGAVTSENFHSVVGWISHAGHSSVPPSRTYFSAIFSENVSGPRSTETLPWFLAQRRSRSCMGSVRSTESPSFQRRTIWMKVPVPDYFADWTEVDLKALWG